METVCAAVSNYRNSIIKFVSIMRYFADCAKRSQLKTEKKNDFASVTFTF